LLERLLSEHVVMLAAWNALRPTLLQLVAGHDVKLPVVLTEKFIASYTAHINIENAELLPLAARLLSPQQMEQMGRRMAERRGASASPYEFACRITKTMTLTAQENNMNTALSKVPALTAIFWIIKIAATTLGETGGDAVSMSMNLGYLVGTGIFSVNLSRGCGSANQRKGLSSVSVLDDHPSRRPRSARHWLILRIAPLASAMPGVLRCCSSC